MTTAEEIKQKKDTDLVKLLDEKREALRSVRFNAAGGKSRNTQETKVLRRDIARILTELQARSSQE